MQVNVLEAKSQLSKLVKAALEGEEVIVARNGEPMVQAGSDEQATQARWLGAAQEVRRRDRVPSRRKSTRRSDE